MSKMYVIALLLVLASVVTVNTERHSLTYIYTALSRDPNIPGIHEFTAMGILDTRVIDYFDSTTQVKTNKTSWMKERLPQEYWEKGTRSRKSKQQWFKVNLDILKERMNQTDNDIHVLQWRHGCEGVEQPDGSLKYIHGLDMYSYDGDDFLSFDDSDSVWVAPVAAAEQTKRKWDEVQVLKDYTKGYLQKECMEWLKKFLTYGKKDMKKARKPDVYVFATNARSKTNLVLNCMATGFYPPEIQMYIKRNSRILSKDDGVMSTGTRPNEDNTYQRRESVEILRSDVATYSCHIIHHPTGVDTTEMWDGKLPEPEPDSSVPVGAIVGVLVLVLVLGLGLMAVLLILYKRGRLGGSQGSLESGDSGVPDAADEKVPLNQKENGAAGGSQGSLESGDSGVPRAADEKVPLNQKENGAGGSQGSLESGDSGVPRAADEKVPLNQKENGAGGSQGSLESGDSRVPRAADEKVPLNQKENGAGGSQGSLESGDSRVPRADTPSTGASNNGSDDGSRDSLLENRTG